MTERGATRTTEELRAQVAGQEWYHTLELAPGIVTPGWFDTRSVVDRLPFPASLAGQRCLDIGTFDGFWAFEMERRGAAEVVAIDLLDPHAWDWPVNSTRDVIETLAARKREGAGFHLAHRAFDSDVRHLERSVYDLDEAQLGRFDFVYFGSLLLHLRDPVRALEHVRAVCDGNLLLVDVIDPFLSRLFPRRPLATLDADGRPWWWQSNLAGIVRMVEAAGFALIAKPLRVRMPRGEGQPAPPLSRQVIFSLKARKTFLDARLGDPHAAILARPR